jgi:Kdo2-lipid IVA lauroyltransferase/acyltransferase
MNLYFYPCYFYSRFQIKVSLFMNLVVTIILVIFIGLFALIPFWLMYLKSDFLAFILGSVLKYRRKVVVKNLMSCFPDLDKIQINAITARFYKNLTDIFLETVKVFSMTSSQIIKRYVIVNTDIIQPFLDERKSVIAITGHYNNWEWGSLSAGLQIKSNVVGFYKPLSNKWMNKLILRNRSRTGTKLVSIYETSNKFSEFANVPSVYLMAADQSPSNHNKAYWVNFFGIDTAFLHGPEKYARDYNYAVIYIDIQRIKRGYYRCELSLLADYPSELKEGEITRRFASKLEEVIIQKPENWLWSHRRWKLKRSDLN